MSGLYRPEDVALVYATTFYTAGRHSRFVGDHWLPAKGDPTIPDVLASLTAADGPTFSAYFLRDDSTTVLLALDTDGDDGLDVARRIARHLLAADVPCYLEPSRRGAHLWVVLGGPMPAIVARRAMLAAIQLAGLEPADPKIEVRPSSDKHSSDFAGGALRTPWQRHPETGERFTLADPATGEPVHPKIAGALALLRLAEPDAILGLAGRYVPPAPVAVPRRLGPPTGETVTEVLAHHFGVIATPGATLLCPVHEDRRRSAKVAPDDRRLWCWAPSCPAHEEGHGVSARMLAALAPTGGER